MAGKLGLADMIEALKEELRQLNQHPKTPHYFNIDGAEVELSVGVSKEGNAGVNFWIVQIGGKIKKEHIHKIKVKLSLLEDEDEGELIDPKQREYEKKYGVTIAGPRRQKAKAARSSGNRKAAAKRSRRARARR